MNWRRFWPDRLGGQIALLLSLALALEFIGSEWLFQRIENRAMLEARARDLSQHMQVAENLLMQLPQDQRKAKAAALWSGAVRVGWAPAAASTTLATAADDQSARALQAQLRLISGEKFAKLSVRQQGQATVSQWQLRDGSWASVRSDSLRQDRTALRRHIGALSMLVLCVAVIAIVFARKISQPLQKLADHAEGVGRSGEAAAVVEGPFEVRQVAAAYNDMQARMAAQVEERLHALAAVSHDLRTPIARMRLRAAKVNDPALRGHIERDLEEMEAFIGALLDFLSGADPEADRLVDVASLLLTIVHGEQDMGHDAAFQGPEKLEFLTKPVKLQRVMLNLVQNAVRHAGQVVVTLTHQPGGIEILVEDQGPGVAEDQLEKIFEPFARLEASRNRSTGGAGLGLAIVRRSISRMGGTIGLENRREGGLRARIHLPDLSA